MTLYEITNDYRTLLVAIESGEIPEEAISDTLDSVKGSVEIKLDSLASFVKSLLYDAAAIKAEIDALTERKKTKENKADRICTYMFDCMRAAGLSKAESARNLIRIKNNPPSVQIKDETAFINWATENLAELLTIAPPKPNKVLIKKAIKQGDEIPWCSLIQEESLTIK